ncbi:CsgG/HfaB family protein [Xanthovirga aplysinae]|uniref:CsgG/HfaB family protein n=1 Tax=Xanthovirga aplysinae TaxID=2529853 RepID=UPI0012BC06D1|nr:CsgG/HfaB family protein [Xanthovirga aplysinae]MTI29875.1 curli production assembly/transport component CsgG [Xanthovirga aplysinae]
MNKSFSIYRSFLLLIGVIFFQTSCTSYLYQPMMPTGAQLGSETKQFRSLKALPEPENKIVVAVYNFRDQTGQYKPSEVGASWSTAVTQGATSILMRALEKSGWFTPIEREGLSNLLNERKIIRSTRANFAQANDEKAQALPPLLYAGVVLEGGIISYDANVLTGGAGVRYLGIGASGQYRQDRVTIYLRAVSTKNGKVLKTVYTSKNILSKKIDGGVFKFVDVKDILEAESGYTYNEPATLAVTAAIEKAVEAMVVEGVEEGLWKLKNEEDRTSVAIKQYRQEKVQMENTDLLGRVIQPRRARFGVGMYGGAALFAGDYSNAILQPVGELSLLYGLGRSFAATFSLGQGRFANKGMKAQTFSYIEFGGIYRVYPMDAYTPYFKAGFGVTNVEPKFDLKELDHWYQHTSGEVGMEFLLNKRMGLNTGVSYNYIFSDKVDGLEQGKYKDYFWRGKIGLNIYFIK